MSAPEGGLPGERPWDPTETEERDWLYECFEVAVGGGWVESIDIEAHTGFMAIYRRLAPLRGSAVALLEARNVICEALRYAEETIQSAVEDVVERKYDGDPPEE